MVIGVRGGITTTTATTNDMVYYGMICVQLKSNNYKELSKSWRCPKDEGPPHDNMKTTATFQII